MMPSRSSGRGRESARPSPATTMRRLSAWVTEQKAAASNRSVHPCQCLTGVGLKSPVNVWLDCKCASAIVRQGTGSLRETGLERREGGRWTGGVGRGGVAGAGRLVALKSLHAGKDRHGIGESGLMRNLRIDAKGWANVLYDNSHDSRQALQLVAAPGGSKAGCVHKSSEKLFDGENFCLRNAVEWRYCLQVKARGKAEGWRRFFGKRF